MSYPVHNLTGLFAVGECYACSLALTNQFHYTNDKDMKSIVSDPR